MFDCPPLLQSYEMKSAKKSTSSGKNGPARILHLTEQVLGNRPTTRARFDASFSYFLLPLHHYFPYPTRAIRSSGSGPVPHHGSVKKVSVGLRPPRRFASKNYGSPDVEGVQHL